MVAKACCRIFRFLKSYNTLKPQGGFRLRFTLICAVIIIEKLDVETRFYKHLSLLYSYFLSGLEYKLIFYVFNVELNKLYEFYFTISFDLILCYF